MTSSINPQIFREYDIRGIVGQDLTPESVASIGKAIGTYIRRAGGKKNGYRQGCAFEFD